MPQLIEHIDAIARKKMRGVLFVVFHAADNPNGRNTLLDSFDWERAPVRKSLCRWLTEQRIPWCECGEVANERCMRSYQGQVFVDVPFDEMDPKFRQVREYLEHPDGSMRFETATFCYLSLELAMKNAHHDAPGFWEKWAENF